VAERQERAFSVVETAWTEAPGGGRAWGRSRGFERLVKKKKSETETHTERLEE